MDQTNGKGNHQPSRGLRGVIVSSQNGRILCGGSLAIAWLKKYFPLTDLATRLPFSVRQWLRLEAKRRRSFSVDKNGHQLVITLVESEAGGPHCLVLQERAAANRAGGNGSTSLTQREVEVLSWVAQGKANWAIGKILNLSPGTVRKHLQNIYSKLGVENRTAAALCALDFPHSR